jgi:hypothetical protein
MTRSNLHIKLSNGKNLICVAESSSAPEQGYIVEQLLLPLLACDDAVKEMALLTEHCTMNERRINATYRYFINLQTHTVHFFEENYNYKNNTFYTGNDLTDRYRDYVESLNISKPKP